MEGKKGEREEGKKPWLYASCLMTPNVGLAQSLCFVGIIGLPVLPVNIA
jgi:hypothetical protein